MGNIQCGRALTEDCLGDSDKRYDEDASNNLKDQSIVWQISEGYFQREYYFYGPDYQPMLRDPFVGIFKTFPAKGFSNITVDGTRFSRLIYQFQESSIPTVPGLALYYDTYGHSTHEKDGTMSFLSLQSSLQNATDFVKTQSGILYPVGNSSAYANVYTRNDDGSVTQLTEQITCLDAPQCDNWAYAQAQFRNGQRTIFIAGTYSRISEQEFIDGINQAYDNNSIPEDQRQPVPMVGNCITGRCPDEEDYCENGDPSCSESPYQEPDGKVKPGVIAAFTVGGVIILVALLYMIHRSIVKKQAESNRAKFASRVAETMSIKKSMRSLTPDMLEKEFNKIDQEHGGRISKDALWEFLNSGKAGEIAKHDFEALWAVIDADKSGSVDFLEFCAYMAHCQDEYNKAVRANRGSMAVAASVARMSVARNVSVKVTESQAFDAAEMEGEEEEAKEKETNEEEN